MTTTLEGTLPPLPPPPMSSVSEDRARLEVDQVALPVYELRDLMGGGSTSRVYRAYDPREHRPVVVKILDQRWAASAPLRRRFIDVARRLVGCAHPNLVRLDRFGVLDDGRPWVAMESLSGTTLRRVQAERPILTVAEARSIARQLLAALAGLHLRGVLHRDVKPENCMIDGLPGLRRLKLLDFGVSACLSPDGVYVAEDLSGTIGYMVPEQAEGRVCDGRSDLFGVGRVLRDLLRDLRADGHDRHDLKALRDLAADCLRADPRDRPDGITDAIRRVHELCDDAERVWAQAG